MDNLWEMDNNGCDIIQIFCDIYLTIVFDEAKRNVFIVKLFIKFLYNDADHHYFPLLCKRTTASQSH